MAETVRREEVLAWMVANSAGAKAAATHFKISVNTVKTWKRVLKKGDPEVKPQPPTPPVARVITPPDRVIDRLPADDLTLLSVHLRRAVLNYSTWLASPAALADSKGAANISRALDTLLNRRADLLTFDAATRPEGSTQTSDDLDAVVRAALARAGAH